MTIRSDKFKNGNNWVKEHPTFQDMNDTNDNILNFVGSGMSENAYRTLQSNNVFTNGDSFVVDEFTDADGTNDTVNTGSTTAIFDVDKYQLAIDVTGSPLSIVTGNSFSFTGGSASNMGYKFTTVQNCVMTSVTKDSDNTATTAFISTNWSASGTPSGVIETATFSSDVATFSEDLLLLSGQTYYVGLQGGSLYTDASETYPKTDANVSVIEAYNGGTSSTTAAYSIASFITTASDYETSSNVLCDSNTKTLDGTEESICVYADKTIPTDTSITVDITDGTTTLSEQPLNIVIGLDGFGAGTLELTFNLSTTNTSASPTISGYGVYIK